MEVLPIVSWKVNSAMMGVPLLWSDLEKEMIQDLPDSFLSFETFTH